MESVDMSLWWNLVMFAWVTFACGWITRRLKMPTVVGYVIAGSIMGTMITASQVSILNTMASGGLIILLFTLGLETDLGFISKNSKKIVLGGSLQVFITGLLLMMLLMFFGISFGTAWWAGQFLAVASTAVISKLIQEDSHDNKQTESLVIGTLVWQDVLSIPGIILLTSASGNLGWQEIALGGFLAVFKAFFVVFIVYFIGKIVVPRIVKRLAVLPTELLNIAIILLVSLCVVFFGQLGISATVAAFLAGVLVGQTREHAHIFGQIRPLKDLLTAIFFVYLGSTVPLGALFGDGVRVLTFLILLLFIKWIVVSVISYRMGAHLRVSFNLGAMLISVGEFAFLLFFLAFHQGFLQEADYNFLLSVVVTSLMVSPILYRHRMLIYVLIRKFINKFFPKVWSRLIGTNSLLKVIELKPLEGHVILCGYGKIGKYIGRALKMSNVDFVAIDYDIERVENETNNGLNIIYADPTDNHILDLAQLSKAALLIITIPHRFSVESIILRAKTINPKIKIITRVESEYAQQRIKDLGADVVIQPEFEAALAIVKKVLTGYGVGRDEMVGKLKRLKIEHGMA